MWDSPPRLQRRCQQSHQLPAGEPVRHSKRPPDRRWVPTNILQQASTSSLSDAAAILSSEFLFFVWHSCAGSRKYGKYVIHSNASILCSFNETLNVMSECHDILCSYPLWAPLSSVHLCPGCYRESLPCVCQTSWETVGKRRSVGKEAGPSELKENKERRGGERETSRGRGGANRRGRGVSRGREGQYAGRAGSHSPIPLRPVQRLSG